LTLIEQKRENGDKMEKMEKAGTPLSRAEKALLLALTAAPGLLAGFFIWLLAMPGRAIYSGCIMLALWFAGPGSWFALIGWFGIGGPPRRSSVNRSPGLVNVYSMLVASAAFVLLCLWHIPWK
jgi:heme/copper-type cytochrome/quinol oxidase subunit 1